MLNPEELSAWYARQDFSPQTCSVIDQVRSSEPARRVGGGRRNVSGRYPSRKMGFTIQFESHRIELAGIYEMEHDDSVLEYYDQPPSIKLGYLSAKGHHLGVVHTPDFFVIRKDAAGWEEWKAEEDLRKLAERSPNRYVLDRGCWRSPPGEAHAGQFGLSYRLRSSKEIDWIFQRNIQFLEDYLRLDVASVSPVVRERVLAHVAAWPAISLEELLARTAGAATPDEIYLLVASGEVHVDLHTVALADSGRVHLFTSRDAARRETMTPGKAQILQAPDTLPGIFHTDATLSWDGRNWRVINVGETTVGLLGEDQSFAELPLSTFESLVKQCRIKRTVTGQEPEHRPDGADRLLQANERDLKAANRRVEIVRRHLRGEPPLVGEQAPARTLRRWLARYRAAESLQGAGYLGLLPRTHDRGNASRKLPDDAIRIMNEVIEREFEGIRQKNRYVCWVTMKRACEQKGVLPPSYVTFCLAVRKRAGFQQTLKRKGPRAAYAQEPFYFELDSKTPRHGDRPFEICHIDHTKLDLELTDSTGKYVLGRPWMSLMMDAFSRRALAVYVDFDEPSYRSCMMVLRECVRLHVRFPQFLVVDGGPEFRSTYFETLLARYECTKKVRPAAKARFGSVSERLFGTANTQFIHNLLGNTQVTRNVRQVTKLVDPRRWAVWPLSDFVSRLSLYLYDIYNETPHPALGESPRQAYDAGFRNTGLRLERLISYDHDFTIATLPTTLKGTAMVCPGRGVKINYLFYWSEVMRDPMVEREQVPVRFDPYDAGTAYAFIDGQWVQCHSDYYRTFQGHSVKELLIGSQELRVRARSLYRERQVTASRLAQLFESCEGDELLFIQRLRDRERRVGGAGIQVDTGIKETVALPASTSTDAAEEFQSGGIDQADDSPYERF